MDSQPSTAAELVDLHERERRRYEEEHQQLLHRPGGNENPYLLHQELGDVMTTSATVVRRNDQLAAAYQTVQELAERSAHCSLSDTGNWTNQNVIFTKALIDMFPLALTLIRGALQRDECRGAHYKPEFAMPSLVSKDDEGRRREAETWCDRFNENNKKWLKSTVASWQGDQPNLQYEDVDTSLITPRPRLYGLVGADAIVEVWKTRQQERAATATHAQPTNA